MDVSGCLAIVGKTILVIPAVFRNPQHEGVAPGRLKNDLAGAMQKVQLPQTLMGTKQEFGQ